jgi:hypothetical protein
VNASWSRPASAPRSHRSPSTGKSSRTSSRNGAFARQLIRRQGGDDRKRRVEADAGLPLLPPREERGGGGVVLADSAEGDQRPLRGRPSLLRPRHDHHVEAAHHLVGAALDRAEHPLRLPLGELAEVGPGAREPVEGGVGHPVVVAAGRERTAVGVRAVGRDEHGVVGDRAERRLGRALRLGHGSVGSSEHAGEDAVADRRLERAPLDGAALEVSPQLAERRSLVLVAPELVERLAVGLERRPDGLCGEREHPVGEGEPPSRRERRVRDERRRHGRAVDELHRLFQLGAPDPADDRPH